MGVLRFFLLVVAIMAVGYFIVKLLGGRFAPSRPAKSPTLDTDDDRFRNASGELTSISITGEIN